MCTSLAQTNIPKAFPYSIFSLWIIGRGTSGHMTSSSYLFDSYFLSYCN